MSICCCERSAIFRRFADACRPFAIYRPPRFGSWSLKCASGRRETTRGSARQRALLIPLNSRPLKPNVRQIAKYADIKCAKRRMMDGKYDILQRVTGDCGYSMFSRYLVIRCARHAPGYARAGNAPTKPQKSVDRALFPYRRASRSVAGRPRTKPVRLNGAVHFPRFERVLFVVSRRPTGPV